MISGLLLQLLSHSRMLMSYGHEVLSQFILFFVLSLDSSRSSHNKDMDDSQAIGIPSEIPLVFFQYDEPES